MFDKKAYHRKYNKKYREKNREILQKKALERHKKNPKFRKANKLRYYNKIKFLKPWMIPILGAKVRAKQRGLECNLDSAWGESVWTGFCALTNLPFNLGANAAGPFSPSLDKIDNAKGYTQDNCRFILHGINLLKGVGSDEDVSKICEAYVKFKKKD